MRDEGDSGLEYCERRADEYDATSWEHAGSDRALVDRIRRVLSSLAPMRTVDVGCGTGYVNCPPNSAWQPAA